MILGIILILCGILIALYPPLLSLIIAFLLIFSGILLLVWGYRYQKAAREFRDPFIDLFLKQ